MSKTFITLSTAALIAAVTAGPATAALFANTTLPNGLYTNGLTTNGFGPNGSSFNDGQMSGSAARLLMIELPRE